MEFRKALVSSYRDNLSKKRTEFRRAPIHMFLFIFSELLESLVSAQANMHCKPLEDSLISIGIPLECIYYACMYACEQIVKVLVLHISTIKVVIVQLIY